MTGRAEGVTGQHDISILCSSYNSSEWIEGYCHSLNNQLLQEFSLVFVDAASTDNSLEKFKSFRFREGVKVHVVESAGRIPIYEAWNIAIGECATDYCMNVNTDDRLYPAALYAMQGYAMAFPEVDIFYSRAYVVEDAGHSKLVNLLDWPEYSHDVLLKLCLCGPFPLLKRESIIDAGLFDPEYDIAGDYEMWLRMSRKGYRFRKVPETIGSYFRNPIGISTDPGLEKERDSQVLKLRNQYK